MKGFKKIFEKQSQNTSFLEMHWNELESVSWAWGRIGCVVSGTGLVSVFVWEPAGFSWQVRERRGTAAARLNCSRTPPWEKAAGNSQWERRERKLLGWADQGAGQGLCPHPTAAEGWGWLGLDLLIMTGSVQAFGQMCWVWCSWVMTPSPPASHDGKSGKTLVFLDGLQQQQQHLHVQEQAWPWPWFIIQFT